MFKFECGMLIVCYMAMITISIVEKYLPLPSPRSTASLRPAAMSSPVVHLEGTRSCSNWSPKRWEN